MIPIGQTYRPSGQFDAVSTILAGVAGLLAAVLAGLVIFGWEISGLPTLVIITSLFQGMAVAFALAALFRKSRVRNPVIAGLLGLVCGAVSVATVYQAHYMWAVHKFHDQARDELVLRANEFDPATRARLEAKLAQPYALLDELVLMPDTGHRGLIGYVIKKNQNGEQIGHPGTGGSPTTGIALYLLWAAEALFVIGSAAFVPFVVAFQPFCEDCDRWFSRETRPLHAPLALAQPLASAVNASDPRALAALGPVPDFDAAQGSSIVALQQCDECRQTLANVVRRERTKDKKNPYKERQILKHCAVSREFADAVRAMAKRPAPPAAAAAKG